MSEPISPPTCASSDASCLPRAVVTDDADCLAHSISGWSQDYEQLKGGRFAGSLDELCFGDTQLFLEQTSLALRQRCHVPAGPCASTALRCRPGVSRYTGAASTSSW